MRRIYRTLVAISATILVLYIAMHMALRPPDVAQAISQPDEPSATTNPTETEQTPDQDVVAIGSKVRKELCYTFLLAASDDGNGNADTIMVMTYDVPNQKIGVVSIPRDTVVRTARKTPKINAAYNKGIDVLRDEVSNLLGFPIDFYISVDMKAFVALVDAVGGVTFDVPVEMYYHDPTQNLSIHYQPGVQHLSGQQALEVARFRKNGDGTGYADSDVGRTKTQQMMLTALADKVISWNSVTKVNQFVSIFDKYVETDLSMRNLAYFAKEAAKVDVDKSFAGTTLPGDGTKKYKGYKWCYELYPEESLSILNQYVNPYTQPLTLEDVDFIDIK
jgi:LCP family protein required for cell wall assembly